MLGTMEMLGTTEKVKGATWKVLIYSFFKAHVCHSSSEIKSLIYIICLQSFMWLLSDVLDALSTGAPHTWCFSYFVLDSFKLVKFNLN